MIVKKIEFDGFRNLQKNEIFADKKVNVIYGDNAQGKTNLIESIWLFTGAKSFRGSKDSELIGFDKQTAKIKIEFFGEDREQSAEIKFGEKKEAVLNGVLKKTTSELAGTFHAVVFSPLHIKLVEDGPESRRRFLDTAIGQIYPKYNEVMRCYSRAVSQRNQALRDVKYHSDIYDLIDIFENSIASFGGRIMKYRYRYVSALSRFAPEIYAGISGGKEEIKLKYITRCGEATDSDSLNYEMLLDSLKKSRDDDIAAGNTSIGPHRDDLEIMINGYLVRSFGSQGQKRSAVLCLKLAEAEVLKSSTGEQPIALLDDVMSELDTGRQNFILNHIDGWQVFITCCDPAPLKKLSDGKIFYMENGIIKEV